ncbi:Hypothetical_protein [Hexamita inflata]|uniref:Hypothetical_protein n=1 Tax=Hexamita inflata TaxID=28002 RepID=A0ABP1GFQ1_9EUKA
MINNNYDNQPERELLLQPTNVFRCPTFYRITAWLWPLLLISCIICITISQTIGYGNGSILIGATFTGAFSIGAFMLTVAACCSVRSIKYIQIPCCINKKEVELIELDCMVRSPYFLAVARAKGMLDVVAKQVNYTSQLQLQSETLIVPK